MALDVLKDQEVCVDIFKDLQQPYYAFMADFGEIIDLILAAHELLIAEIYLRDDLKASDLLVIDRLDL